MSTPENQREALDAALASSEGAARVDVLLQLCVACRANATDDSRDYGHQALDAARELGDRPRTARARRETGKYYLGNYQEALEHWKAELALQRELSNRKGEQEALHNIGAVYFGISDHSSALEYYRQSLAIKEDLGDRKREAMTLGNMGLAYVSLAHLRDELSA
jgi:tetratricopeptide (TPR) repeat protein